MIVGQADVKDAAEILALQKLAYRSEAEIYDDYTIPPLTQTLEEMRADIDTQLVLKASIEDRIIGSVRAKVQRGTCFVGRLIVHPDFQNRGIGRQLMRELEGTVSQATRFELFTGSRSERNIAFYQKLGYSPFKHEELSDRVTLVFMEKCVQDDD
jgi:ribosomal protein S18 acetylase RimI-like enzyme